MIWRRWHPDDPDQNQALEKFFKTPGIPTFVSSRQECKLDTIYDHEAGRFWLLEHKDKIIGCCGIYIATDKNGQKYAKFPFRKYTTGPRNLASSVYTKELEIDLLQDWLSKYPDIPVLTTVNEDNERVFFHSMYQLQRFQKNYSQAYQSFNRSLKLYPKLVYEFSTWQYVLFNEKYRNFSGTREEKEIPPRIKRKISDLWQKGFWYGAAGRDEL